ncbi:MAG: heme-binding protein, partial [Granulosicoccaceae bacterium]
MNIRAIFPNSALLAVLLALAACGGGGGGGDGTSPGGTTPDSGCTGQCATTMPANLTTADVDQIIAQAAEEADARGLNATIAVTDRVGNVLGVYRIGAAATFTIRSGLVPITTSSGLENIAVLDTTQAAIAKAVTGAYLASEGNAFSSRTASHIVQEHFSPHETGQPGGPLFGVQFSQLPCSDFVQQGTAVGIGPRRSPLGLSADPGGFPLYKNGQPVGGIGVIADGLYSLDLDILDIDSPNHDEIIALAGQFGYAPPADRQADRITADGRTLRYSDATAANFLADPTAASIVTAPGAYVADITGDYYPGGGARAGTTFAMPNSGIEPADDVDAALYPGLDAFVLTDGSSNNRYTPTAGASNGGENLTANEVTEIVRAALDVANRARAQIRRPTGSQARVSISVVGPDGAILAIARTRDAPMFGTDVSLQKARTATFFSSDDAGTELSGLADANAAGYTSSIAQYVTDVRAFVNDNNALTGTHAFADRSGGN